MLPSSEGAEEGRGGGGGGRRRGGKGTQMSACTFLITTLEFQVLTATHYFKSCPMCNISTLTKEISVPFRQLPKEGTLLLAS